MTNSDFWLKSSITVMVIFFMVLAIGLWWQTPEMFEYFNQAFCTH